MFPSESRCDAANVDCVLADRATLASYLPTVAGQVFTALEAENGSPIALPDSSIPPTKPAEVTVAAGTIDLCEAIDGPTVAAQAGSMFGGEAGFSAQDHSSATCRVLAIDADLGLTIVVSVDNTESTNDTFEDFAADNQSLALPGIGDHAYVLANQYFARVGTTVITVRPAYQELWFSSYSYERSLLPARNPDLTPVTNPTLEALLAHVAAAV